MPDIRTFSLGDMVECAAALRSAVPKEPTMQGAAKAVVHTLFDAFGNDNEDPQLALVRLYKTHPAAALPPEIRAHAEAIAGEQLPAESRCLVLLASAGLEDAWNDPARSKDHRAIPLPVTSAVEGSPMIAALVRQLGLDPEEVVAPTPEIMIHAEQHSFNVFYVEEAAESDYVPDKDFVERYGIRSVVGFGGVLPPGDLFAAILFARRPVPRDIAELFAPVALSVKLALLPFVGERVFA